MNIMLPRLPIQGRWVVLYSIVLLQAFCPVRSAQAQTDQYVPVEITPEAVSVLQSRGEAYLLIDAQQAVHQAAFADNIQLIYYTTGPSFRAAYEAVLRDREASATHEPSRRLTGTPAEWSGLESSFLGGMSPKLEHPTVISPKSLSEAIKDGVDLQIIDLRPVHPPKPGSTTAAAPASLPGAINLLPHQLVAEMPKLSRLRWTVLVDDGNRVAQPIAEHMFQLGYTLICILEGGYPAWVSATNR